MDLIGRNPIPWPAFITAKVCLVANWLFPALRPVGWITVIYDHPLVQAGGILLSLTALIMAILSFRCLGRSLAMGLPDRDTRLKTNGVYRFSRNPMYLSAFTLSAASCLLALHWANMLLMATAVALHVRIIHREEAFLEDRFGQHWRDYSARVPRFVGKLKRHVNSVG